MFVAAVIPALNEEKNILSVIANLQKNPIDLIIPVINGCTDNTLDIVQKQKDSRISPLIFNQPLGVDIPRSIGALWAIKKEADAVIFVDGDMGGVKSSVFLNLIGAVKTNRIDIGLTNCYPFNFNFIDLTNLASEVLAARKFLNKSLGLFEKIGFATPSHGPHILSKKALESIPVEDLAVPPLILAHGVKKNLNISLAASIPHIFLGSAYKDINHSFLIADTIIGDCLEAFYFSKNQERIRFFQGKEYLGYNYHRRFYLLAQFKKTTGHQL